MKSPQEMLAALQQASRVWQTSMGAWFPGERVVLRGLDLFNALQDASWMELLLFTITNRRHDAGQLRLFNALWVLCTSYPDPRIWNNAVAALAATARSTATLAAAAATAVSEASIYGHQPLTAAMAMLHQASRHLAAGGSLQDYIARRRRARAGGRPGSGRERQVALFPGFGRPLVQGDERIAELRRLADRLGYSAGPFLRLVMAMEEELQSQGMNLRANVGILMAALAADQGMTTREFNLYSVYCFSVGFIGCYADALQHEAGHFFPIRCDGINYMGVAPRKFSGAT